MRKSELTDKVIEKLKAQKNEKECVGYYDDSLGKSESNNAYILDVEADGKFQKIFSPEILAEQLKSKDLPDNINTIILLVSDVLPEDHSLSVYASELNYRLKREFNRDIAIKIISDLNYPMTLLCPPESKDGKWQVCGFKAIDLESLPKPKPNVTNFPIYDANPLKKLLWEGADLDEWFGKAVNRSVENVIRLEDEGDGVGYVPSYLQVQ